MPPASRIDTHQHVLPPEHRSWLEGKGQMPGGIPLPTWDASSTIELMDDREAATAIVSVSAPGVHLDPAVTGPDAVARSWAHKVNEFAAELAKDYPDRFGFFATRTLPDVDGAIAEAEYAFDVLGADGVVLLTNAHGTYLGDATSDPLLHALDERSATIFVHPAESPGPPVADVPSSAADFLLEDTRAAIKLAMSGTFDRCGRLKIILSHGGGFAPYAGIASIYLQGIDTREIVDTVHHRRPPVIPASAVLRR